MSGALDTAAAANERAAMLCDLNKFPEALEVVEEALGHFPDDEDLAYTHAWLFIHLGRAGEAREILVRLIESQPEDPRRYFLLSYAESGLDRPGPARAAADRALELAPNAARYHIRVGYLAVDHGSMANREVAKERVASALELAPEDPKTFLSAGEIYRALGKTEEAKAYVASGLALQPDHEALLYVHASLEGDYVPAGPHDYGGLWKAGNEVAAMGALLGSSPDNPAARQALLGRTWTQVLRLTDAPLVLIAIVAISIGLAMGDGPTLRALYLGAGLAGGILIFRLLTARVVLGRAPKGYLRGLVRGGRTARLRLTLSLIALLAGIVGVVCLFVLREASLVRWLLVFLAVAAVLGGIGSALWRLRLINSAHDAGIYAPNANGFGRAVEGRRGLTGAVVRRVLIFSAGGVLALIISSMTRADAAPVLMLALAGWVGSSAVALVRLRRIGADLAYEEGAPPKVAPSVIGGATLALVMVVVVGTVVIALTHVPWTPNARDQAGVYDPTVDVSSSDCAGRFVFKLACLIEERQEPVDYFPDDDEIDIPEIVIPDFETPDINIPDGPDLPEIGVPSGAP